MRRLILFAVLTLMGCSRPVSVVGDYTGQLDEPNMKPELNLSIRQQGAQVSGTGTEVFQLDGPHIANFAFTGQVKGSQVELRIPDLGGCEVFLRGQVQGTNIDGEAEFHNPQNAPELPGSILRTRPFRLHRK